jgi:CubicO group peptidase (beta-lactamase class C family)
MTSYRNSDPRPLIMQGSPPSLVPPRMDWDRPPWNRWSFQHVREILPTVEVWRGRGPVLVLNYAKRMLDTLAVTGVDGEAATLSTLLDQTYTDGFMVLHKGSVVAEQYFNGMDERTLHLSQSVAKSVVGTVAGILIGRGVLDVDAPFTTYLPELEATGWKGATLQHVLDMTTGVRFSEEYTDPYSDIGQVDVACGWKPVPAGSDPAFKWPQHMWALIVELKDTIRAHGAEFHYRSIETDVLAFAMERATGKRLAQLVSEELWQKMGAERNACFTVDPAGYALADGGFNACLRDYARFGQLWLEGGGGIIPKSWVNETRNGVHGRFTGRYASSLPDGAYHNQFWIDNSKDRSLMCRGVFGQWIYVDYARDTVIVKLSSWPDFVDPKLERATFAAGRVIAETLSSSR